VNSKIFYAAIAVLGVMLLALSAYQFNQWWNTRATLQPSLTQLDEIAGDAETLAALGLGAADVESTRSTMTGALDAMMQVALADLVLGVLLFAAGVSYYPREHAQGHY